jgi:hypothetical protein
MEGRRAAFEAPLPRGLATQTPRPDRVWPDAHRPRSAGGGHVKSYHKPALPRGRAPAPAQANPHLRSSPAQSATPPAGRAANEGPSGTQRVRLLRLGSASGERTAATRFMSVPLLGHVLHARATGGAASLALMRCGAGVPNGAQLGTSPRPLFEMESLARPAEAAGSKNSR